MRHGIIMQSMTINVETRAKAMATVVATVGRSLMQSFRDAGLVEALCGGQAACATCHVHVDQDWMPAVGNATGQEADMLDTSLEKKPNSRLSCQIIVTGAMEGLAVKVAPSES